MVYYCLRAIAERARCAVCGVCDTRGTSRGDSYYLQTIMSNCNCTVFLYRVFYGDVARRALSRRGEKALRLKRRGRLLQFSMGLCIIRTVNDGKGLTSDVILLLMELYKIVVYRRPIATTALRSESHCPPTKLT